MQPRFQTRSVAEDNGDLLTLLLLPVCMETADGAITPGQCNGGDGSQDSVYAKPALYQMSYIFSPSFS